MTPQDKLKQILANHFFPSKHPVVKELEGLIESIVDTKRTNQQNKSLHKYCELIAVELNEKGLDVEAVLKNYTIDLYWTKDNVKNLIVKPIIDHMFEKQSTTQLEKTGEIDKVVDVVTKFLAKAGISYIPFPSIDEEAKQVGEQINKNNE